MAGSGWQAWSSEGQYRFGAEGLGVAEIADRVDVHGNAADAVVLVQQVLAPQGRRPMRGGAYRHVHRGQAAVEQAIALDLQVLIAASVRIDDVVILVAVVQPGLGGAPAALGKGVLGAQVVHMARGILIGLVALVVDDRSEERRVGKGGGSRQPTAAAGIEAPGRVVLSGGRMREKSKAGAVRTHQDEYV